MYEIVHYFIQTKGICKGMELNGSYKLPERELAVLDAQRLAKRKNTTGVSVLDLETGNVVAYWNRQKGWGGEKGRVRRRPSRRRPV